MSPLYLDNEEAGARWKEERHATADVSQIPLSAYPSHTQVRSDCATEGSFIFIYLSHIIIIYIIYVAPVRGSSRQECERFRENAKLFRAVLAGSYLWWNITLSELRHCNKSWQSIIFSLIC